MARKKKAPQTNDSSEDHQASSSSRNDGSNAKAGSKADDGATATCVKFRPDGKIVVVADSAQYCPECEGRLGAWDHEAKGNKNWSALDCLDDQYKPNRLGAHASTCFIWWTDRFLFHRYLSREQRTEKFKKQLYRHSIPHLIVHALHDALKDWLVSQRRDQDARWFPSLEFVNDEAKVESMIESVFTTAVRKFDGMCRQRAASRLQVNATATLTNSVLHGPCARAKVTGGLADYNNFVTATTSGRRKKRKELPDGQKGLLWQMKAEMKQNWKREASLRTRASFLNYLLANFVHYEVIWGKTENQSLAETDVTAKPYKGLYPRTREKLRTELNLPQFVLPTNVSGPNNAGLEPWVEGPEAHNSS